MFFGSLGNEAEQEIKQNRHVHPFCTASNLSEDKAVSSAGSSWVDPARNQGQAQAVWTFAALGSV